MSDDIGEVTDPLWEVYQKLSAENQSTQRSLASATAMISEVKSSLDQFLAEERKRRRERCW